jgi:hypothetical protein
MLRIFLRAEGPAQSLPVAKATGVRFTLLFSPEGATQGELYRPFGA